MEESEEDDTSSVDLEDQDQDNGVNIINHGAWSYKKYLPYVGYTGVWLLITAAEGGYAAMVFSTSTIGTNAIIKSFQTFFGDKLNEVTLKQAMYYINIISSLCGLILIPLSLLDVKKQFDDAKDTWVNGTRKCLSNSLEKFIFVGNLSLFTFSSISACLSIPAALVELLRYNPSVYVLAPGGFVGQVVLFWLIGSAFIFDVPEKLKNLPQNYREISANIIGLNVKSISFILRTLVAVLTRAIKLYGAAAYTVKHLLPNSPPGISISYGTLTSISHIHNCIFTQTVVDYEETFGQGHITKQTKKRKRS